MDHLTVLFVTTSPPTRTLGGPGRVVPMLAEAFASSFGGGEVRILALMDDQLYREPRSFAWSDESLPNPREGPVKRLYHALALLSMARGRQDGRLLGEQVKKIVQENGVHLVHAHDFWSAYHITPNAGVPLLFTNQFKGSFYREYLAPTYPHFRSERWKAYYTGIERGAIQRTGVLVFPSSSAQDLLIQDFPDQEQEICRKARIIYNGIPPVGPHLPEEGSLSGRETAFVLNVANHVPDKGIEVALQVFQQLKVKAFPELRFINVGEHGSQTPALKERATQLGLQDCVEFVGRRSHEEVLSLLARAALMVHTPHRVVFDLVLLEAMALGKVVVASDARGNLEALGEDYPFVLSNPAFLKGGEPRVAEGIESPGWIPLLFDPSERDHWGSYLKGRFSERFTMKRMAEDHLNLWSEVNLKASDITGRHSTLS